MKRATNTKRRWEGHSVRTDPTRWAHDAPMWDPYIGMRRQVRPKLIWADIFTVYSGPKEKKCKGVQRTRKILSKA